MCLILSTAVVFPTIRFSGEIVIGFVRLAYVLNQNIYILASFAHLSLCPATTTQN